MGIEKLKVPKFLAFKGVKRDFNHMICRDAIVLQVFLKKGKQQIGFSAAAHSGNDLNKPIVLFQYQLIQVIITTYLQDDHLY